ncbi:hypothetical protein RJ639_010908 [Escallonia herrerae]|uniref:F-box domain-containing protein n=1 Tax=Escallonia herrerae TaxID=1293975 RepID=A0AA88VTL2_9ASTE|nr:hypothetical protein RJ639_010908 [Escallonia herrerae]
MENSLPDDIALKIVSTLQASDVFSLGNCSRFWRELCALDCVWAALCRDRWPALELDPESCAPEIETHQLDQHTESTFKGWRGFYISKLNEMAIKAAVVVDFVERCLSYESIEVGHYLAAIQELCSVQFGFKDVQTFFLKPKLHVLLNLVGLHYCITWLGVPAEHVKEALDCCKISDRQICVQWWKLGRWLYGFRLRDESHSRNISLGDLAMPKDEEVLGVLHRGAIHEVLRVQISAAKPTYIPWSCQSAQVLY